MTAHCVKTEKPWRFGGANVNCLVMKTTDVLLIGAGPIGLEMAVALQEAGYEYVHLEARQVAHTISWFPKQARFFSSPERIAICGVPLRTLDQSKATREEYISYLLGIVQQYGLQIRTYERVTRVSPCEGEYRYEVETSCPHGGETYRARHVIFTIGDMHGPRPLTLDGETPVEGTNLPHVSSYFDEPHPYFGRKLLIVGGRNSAAEAAVRCYRAGAQVALSYRRSELDSSIKYWLKPEIEWLIRHDEIKFFPQTVPSRISRTHVTLSQVGDDLAIIPGSDFDEAFDFVLLLIGYRMDGSLLARAGVELEGVSQTPNHDPTTMETNLPGVYMAGTAAAGTQLRFKLFIENCHAHVVRIMRHLGSKDPTHINPLAYSDLKRRSLIAES